MRRSLSCILFFFLFLPLQAKEYKVLRSTVRVEPLRDGGLAVEEENLYLFTKGRFSYVFRTVPLQRRGGEESRRSSWTASPFRRRVFPEESGKA